MIATKAQYRFAESLDHAIEMAQEFPGNFSYIAGGTDLVPNRFLGHAKKPL